MSSQRRVKVTSPQTRIALARRHRSEAHLLPLPAPADIAAARALHSAQRRIAIRTMLLLASVIFGLSGLIATAPGLDQVQVLGIPVSWLLVAVITYPLLLSIAIFHVRAAERAERR